MEHGRDARRMQVARVNAEGSVPVVVLVHTETAMTGTRCLSMSRRYWPTTATTRECKASTAAT